MFRRIFPFFILLLSIIWLIILFLYIWIFEHGDSYYYLSFAEFVRTGSFAFRYPFIFSKPTTIAAPFYSFIILFFNQFPRAEIFLHAAHLLFLTGSAYLLFKMLKTQINSNIAILISFIFLILPSNTIFTSYIMTEIPAQFLFTLFVFEIFGFLKTRSNRKIFIILFVTSIMTLLRYQFGLFFIIFLIVGIFLIIKRKAKSIDFFFFIISTVMIFSWIIFNYKTTGVWGLSDTTKIRFHAALVQTGKLIPPENSPAVIEFRKYIPSPLDITLPWWDQFHILAPKVNYDWSEIDRIIGNVGITALRTYPFQSMVVGIKNFIYMHINPATPWWRSAGTFSTYPDPNLPVDCRNQNNYSFCIPIIKNNISSYYWDRYVRTASLLYKGFIPALNIFIFFPILIWSLIFGTKKLKISAILYIFPLLISSISITPESRYLFPFYPLMLYIITDGLYELNQKIRNNHKISTLLFLYLILSLYLAWHFLIRGVFFVRTDLISINEFIPPFIGNSKFGDYQREPYHYTLFIWWSYLIGQLLLIIFYFGNIRKKIFCFIYGILVFMIAFFVCADFWVPPIPPTLDDPNTDYSIVKLGNNFAVSYQKENNPEIISYILTYPEPLENFIGKKVLLTGTYPSGNGYCELAIKQCFQGVCHPLFEDVNQTIPYVCPIIINSIKLD